MLISSFLDLESLGMFVVVSCLFMISAFRFNFQAMKAESQKISLIFLVSGLIVGFSDLILILHDRDAMQFAGDGASMAKQVGVTLLAPFYGVLFASVTWFSADADKYKK